MENNKRKALGRGLEQLFSNESIYVEPERKIIEELEKKSEDEIVLIDIKELRSNPYQPRQSFDQEKLVELANSIKEHGVIEPIIVKKSIKGYEIVAGERRKKACELIGVEQIPSIIKNLTDEQMMEVALLENIQREDLTAIEEAEAYLNLIKALGITQNELSDKIGKSRSYITNTLGLLRLPESVKNDILHNFISQGHAKILSKLEDENQIILLANRVKKEHLSVRALEELVSNPELKRKKEIKIKPKQPEYKYIEEIMREKIGSKVKVKNKNIIIPFSDDRDLERILELLKVEIKVD